jgi:hypothetical protein
MKTCLIILCASVFSLSSQADVDCLRFMSKNSKIIWQKTCQVILEDRSHNEIESVDICLAKFSLENQKFIVINGDLIKKDGYIKKDVIISKARIGTVAQETNQTISYDLMTASPELFRRYRHIVTYSKDTENLSIQKFEGIFKLKEKYHLNLSCE